MIKLRKHPEATWTEPYKNEYIDEKNFQQIENVTFWKEEGDKIYLKGNEVLVTIEVCTDEIIRISVSPEGEKPSPMVLTVWTEGIL